MIKFEKRFLYTFADVEEAKKLIGVKGLFFDDILDVSDLKTLIPDELISLSGDDYWVGLCFKSIIGNFRYFYYDPNLECKRAYYLDGKKIQRKDVSGDWVVDLEPKWYDNYEYRIKPETKTHLTNRQVAEWLAKGNGQINLDEVIDTRYSYYLDKGNDLIDKNFKIRKWSDSEWHEATKEYIGDVE